MSAVDWSAMTVREVWESLRSAPKVAGPWRRAHTGHMARHRRDGRVLAWEIARVDVLVDDGEMYPKSHPDRAAADAALRAAGWLLVDDDEGGGT